MYIEIYVYTFFIIFASKYCNPEKIKAENISCLEWYKLNNKMSTDRKRIKCEALIYMFNLDSNPLRWRIVITFVTHLLQEDFSEILDTIKSII